MLLCFPNLNFIFLIGLYNLHVCMKSDCLMLGFFIFENTSKIFICLSSMLLLLSSMLYNNNSQHLLNMCIMLTSIFFFSSMNIIMIFFSFEIVLLPMMIIIILWGYQKERLQASMYLVMYTTTYSLPSIGLLFIFLSENMTSFLFLKYWITFDELCSLLMMMPFLVKYPIYLMHNWLTKAHVEAPTFGSMQLAGVLLKLGVYGFLRFSCFIETLSFTKWSMLFSFLFVLGMSMGCQQNDLKLIIACNSIGHMTFLFCICINCLLLGYESCCLMSMSHGVVASMLFLYMGEMYNYSNTRCLFMSNCLTNFFLLDLYLIILLLLTNVGTAPLIGVIPEMFCISNLYKISKMYTLLLFLFFLMNNWNSLRIMLIFMNEENNKSNLKFKNENNLYILMILSNLMMFLFYY